MNLPELRDRIFSALDEEIDRRVLDALNVRRNPGVMNGGKMLTPPSTAEDLALTITEINAYRRGLDRAREIVFEQYQKLVTPDSIPSGAGEEEGLADKYYQ